MTLRSAKSGSGYSLWGWHKCRNRSDCRANSLDALGVIGGTDKSSVAHDYLRHYDRIFAQYRDEPINLIEIGVSRGASLHLWQEYFRAATVIGIDIRPQNKLYEQGRMIVEIGSQDDPEFLAHVCTKYPPTIIIDDGSHRADHVLFTLERYVPDVAAIRHLCHRRPVLSCWTG